MNAWVLTRLDEACAEAVAADRALASGDPVGPLRGVASTAKEAIAIAGMRRPSGSRLFADERPGHDAPAIRRMRRSGAILIAKTDVPEFCAFL